MARMTGPETSSAGVPRPSCVHKTSNKRTTPEFNVNNPRKTHLYTCQRYTEQDDTLQTLLHQRSDEALKFVHAPPTLAGQSRNLNTCIWIVGDENGIHKHGFRELALGLPFSRGGVRVATLEDGTEDLLEMGLGAYHLTTHEMSIIFGDDEDGLVR